VAARKTSRKRNYPQSRWWHAVADADGIKSVAYTGTLKGAENAGRKIEAAGYRALLMPAQESDAKGWRKEWKMGLKNPDWGQVLVPLSAITPVHEVRMFDWKDKLIQEMRENGWVGRPLLVLREGKGDFGALTGSHRFGALAEMYKRKEWPKNLPYGKVPVVILEKSDFKNREGNNGWGMIHDAVSDEDRAYVIAQFLKNDESHPNSPAIQIMAEELARDHESWTQHERVSPAMDRLRDKLSPFDYMRAQVMANPAGDIQDRFSKQLADRLWPGVKRAGTKEELHQEIHAAMHQVAEPGRAGNPNPAEQSAALAFRRRLFQRLMEGEPVKAGESYAYNDKYGTDFRKATKADVKVVLKEFRLRRRNPDTSAEMFEDFHGEPPSTVTEFNETEHYSDDLAKLGTLVELKVRTITGLEAVLGFNGSAPELASTPDGRQLYFLGGDQSLDLDKLKMGGSKWERDFMVIGDLDELTYRTAKGFDHFKLSDYYHKLGEESGYMPTLIYDRLNQRLQVAGGQYHNEKSGINN
jgi:hypothetical protein